MVATHEDEKDEGQHQRKGHIFCVDFFPYENREKSLDSFFVLDYINTRFVKPELNVHAKEQTSLSLSRLLLVAKRKSREWRKNTRNM